MPHDHKKILEYWNRAEVESMYDKHLLHAEINLIKSHISPNSKILDAGCGEGEGALEYSKIRGVKIHAADYSETRLKKAQKRLLNCKNIILKQVDFLHEHSLDNNYDIIISQRFLINFKEWHLQCKVLLNLMAMLKKDGKLLILEGSKQGVDSLNEMREIWGLKPIVVKWHNLFFDDDKLLNFMQGNGYKLSEKNGFGAYFFLTRAVRPNLDKELNWDCEFNRIASSRRMEELLAFADKFSRLKFWVFRKMDDNKRN
jgi:ubiquinone/menaquinone biosynthesis C-methylase UbiE